MSNDSEVIEANIAASQASLEDFGKPHLVADNGQSYAVLLFDGGYKGDDLHNAIKRRRKHG